MLRFTALHHMISKRRCHHIKSMWFHSNEVLFICLFRDRFCRERLEGMCFCFLYESMFGKYNFVNMNKYTKFCSVGSENYLDIFSILKYFENIIDYSVTFLRFKLLREWNFQHKYLLLSVKSFGLLTKAHQQKKMIIQLHYNANIMQICLKCTAKLSLCGCGERDRLGSESRHNHS